MNRIKFKKFLKFGGRAGRAPHAPPNEREANLRRSLSLILSFCTRKKEYL